MISAFPPEEEVGWTPWEIWYKDDQGITRKESWVLYPLKDTIQAGSAHWYKLEDEGLLPTVSEQTRQPGGTATPCTDR